MRKLSEREIPEILDALIAIKRLLILQLLTSGIKAKDIAGMIGGKTKEIEQIFKSKGGRR
jgi:hypothetical protein